MFPLCPVPWAWIRPIAFMYQSPSIVHLSEKLKSLTIINLHDDSQGINADIISHISGIWKSSSLRNKIVMLLCFLRKTFGCFCVNSLSVGFLDKIVWSGAQTCSVAIGLLRCKWELLWVLPNSDPLWFLFGFR